MCLNEPIFRHIKHARFGSWLPGEYTIYRGYNTYRAVKRERERKKYTVTEMGNSIQL